MGSWKMVLVALVVAIPIHAAAAENDAWRRPPEARIVVNSLLVARYNPPGLELQVRGGYQRRLYDHASPALRDNFFFAGVYPRLNPAFARVGPVVELQPASIFNLRLTAEWVQFFSTMGFLQSFPDAGAEHSTLVLESGKGAGNQYAAGGTHFAVEPLLQLKLGKVAVRGRAAFEHWSMSLRGGDRVWYDATLDTLVPANGFTLSSDLDVIYVAGGGLVAGLRYSAVRPIYDGADASAEGATANGHHRVGPLVAYSFSDDGFDRFSKPTVLVMSCWYLSHRYRAGAEVSRAIPYVVVGFAFQSDLLGGGEGR